MPIDPQNILAAIKPQIDSVNAELATAEQAASDAEFRAQDFQDKYTLATGQLQIAHTTIEDLRRQLASQPAPQPIPTPVPVPVESDLIKVVSEFMSPCTVHLDLWDTVDAMTTPVEWQLTGGTVPQRMDNGNVAFWIDAPGTYIASATFAGKTLQRTIVIKPDTRGEPVKVLPGQSIPNAVKDNTTVLIEGTHKTKSTIGIPGVKNCRIVGAPGAQILNDAYDVAGGSSLFSMSNASDGMTIENLYFDSTLPDNIRVRDPKDPDTYSGGVGIRPDGKNITIRNCRFGQVDSGINCERKPSHVFITGCDSNPLAYTVWGDGTNLVISKNKVHDAPVEHCLRINGERINITENDLNRPANAGSTKTTMAIQTVNQITITKNICRNGVVGIGPLDSRDGRFDDVRAKQVLVADNVIENADLQLNPGTENFIVRGNKVQEIVIRPWSPNFLNWTVKDGVIEGNNCPVRVQPPLEATQANATKYGTTVEALRNLPKQPTNVVVSA